MIVEQSNISTLSKDLLVVDIKKRFIARKMRDMFSIIMKRSIDIVSGIIGLILLIPITVVVFIFNLFSKENGPVFFTQERIGKNGKIFKMYKFRTMIVNAEEILDKHIKENTEIGKEYKRYKKIKNDPRVTKIGRVLRATSLDEFPQFINVIKGEMSLVGPRPYLPSEKEDMGEYYAYIVSMKPGVTGPWQVAGRNNLEFEDRLKLDREYCDRRGNKRDLKIILKTIGKVIKKDGAM